MNIPPGARINFFATGSGGRVEIIPGPPVKAAARPAPLPNQTIPPEAFDRLRVREALDPARIFSARRTDPNETMPTKAPELTLDAAAIYAARRISHDV